jgi:prepilin-type N-terminal cleavage/methylation domain-containing protein
MKPNLQMVNNPKGFTLVEIIVTLMAAGILGVIFINFMGTALESSWNSVEIVRDEAGSEKLMEQIIAEYVALINSNSPGGALDTIETTYHNNTFDGIYVTAENILFDGAGNESTVGSSDNLKVVLRSSGPVAPAITGRYPLTIILTNSRRDADDQIVLY